MSLLGLIASDNFIPVNRDLLKLFGLHATVMLGELCSQYNYWERENKLVDDMFYCSSSKLKENTGLSEYEQKKAIKVLEDAGIVSWELKGCPATKYFKIDIIPVLKNLRTSSEKTGELVLKNLCLSNNINNKIIINKTKISKDILDNNGKKSGSFEFGKTKSSEDNNSKIGLFLEWYNEYCKELSTVRKLTDKRKKGILRLFKDYSQDDIKQVLINVSNSDFLLGKATDFKANLDWILNDNNFIKILEGRYSNKKVKRVSKDIEHINADKIIHATDEQKRQFKEDIASGKAEKF